MLQQYEKWNRWISKFLWILVAIGLVASAPLIAGRVEMERSSNQVDFVFDYRDLMEISTFKAEPQLFIKEKLLEMKEAGITGLAIYESTLSELEMSGSVQLFSAEDAALLNGDEDLQQSNYTYLLFSDEQAATALEPIIQEGFSLLDIETKPWSYKDKKGLAIAVGVQEATVIPLDPDPVQLALLQDYGFRLSVRLSDARPYDQARMDALFGRLTDAGVGSIIFAGSAVTGFAEDPNKLALTGMAELIKKYKLEVAVIDLSLAKQQMGLTKLAFLTDYQAVRLHSILEEEATTDANVLADRFVLAVKDRNFRMIYLNARMKVDKEQGTVNVPLLNVYMSLNDPEFGAIERIKDLGYSIGQPKSFKQQVTTAWDKLLKAIALIGAIALITWMSRFFLPRLTLLVLLAGLGFTAMLYMLNSTLTAQALALLAAVSAPTVAVIQAMTSAERRRDGQAGSVVTFGWSLGIFLRTIALSLIGAVFTVALLNHISYIIVLNQFRGVSVLHTLPIMLVALYVVLFHRTSSLWEVVGRTKHLLALNIRVFWVVLAGFAGVVLYYYMSRTGNQGSVSPYEKMFRSLLENTLGARPRTKELLTHPFIIIGLYLFVKYRKHGILAFFVIGTMGQLSVVDTFAHLHTPLDISILRVIYGVIISSFIALVYVAVWELLVRGWRRWQQVFQE
ncbi:MAG: DUF5693 family protein [Paenibacillaceae bacterium]